MRNPSKKKLWVAFCLVMAATMVFAGCQATPAPVATTAASQAPQASSAAASTAPAAPSAAALQPVTLKIILFGDKATATDDVWNAIAAETKDRVNATFETTWIPGSDYAQKLIAKAASGDDWDFNFDGDWLAYAQMVTQNAYLDVMPLLAKDAPDLYATYQKLGSLKPITVNGKVFALPWTMSMNQRAFAQWRKDLADAAGLKDASGNLYANGSIKTLDDFDTLLEGLRKAYPDKKICEGIDFRGVSAKYDMAQMNYNFVYSLNDAQPKLQHMAFTDAFKEMATWDKKWQDAGIIWKDYLTDKHDGNALISQGILISNVTWHEWAFGNSDWGQGSVRANSELYPDHKQANRTPLANIVCINANSKNPDRSLMFLNLLETDQKLYDLLQYGIEGKTYVLGPNGEANYPAGMTGATSNYMEWGGQWAFWKPQFMRPNPSYPKDFWVHEAEFAAQPENVNSPYVAFLPDPTSVQNQLTQIAGIDDQYQKQLKAGLEDNVDQYIAEYQQKLKDAGIDQVTAEFQKQFDAFAATVK